MIDAVSHSNRPPPVKDCESKKPESLYKIFKQYNDYLDLFRLPFKGISCLFGWAELAPLGKDVEEYIANQRSAVKAISSTFNVPAFFIKQSKFYQACSELKNNFAAEAGIQFDRVVHSVKNVFFRTISLIAAGLKIPLIFDKLRLIDLGKISRQLPDKLSKGEHLLSLGLTSMKLVDSVWILGNQLSKDQAANSGKIDPLSPKAVKSIIKVGSKSVKFISISASVATLFLGIHIDPVALALLSSTSFGVSLVGKIACKTNLIWKGGSRDCKLNSSHLPA